MPSTPDSRSFETQLEIAAPRDVVWRAIASDQGLRNWFAPEAAFDEYVRRLGDQGFERLDARDGWMLFRRTKRDARDHSSA